ncbi:MAG: hypothetical protein KME05_16495 [Gloeocapsa sp. UFS-A4-WI-NPMV-4B04]|jgi:hypothetical protein|nr:hypothetical protein [Gloeocapsa sp. UFS-A4-WI-NPMV-4B04]
MQLKYKVLSKVSVISLNQSYLTVLGNIHNIYFSKKRSPAVGVNPKRYNNSQVADVSVLETAPPFAQIEQRSPFYFSTSINLWL